MYMYMYRYRCAVSDDTLYTYMFTFFSVSPGFLILFFSGNFSGLGAAPRPSLPILGMNSTGATMLEGRREGGRDGGREGGQGNGKRKG